MVWMEVNNQLPVEKRTWIAVLLPTKVVVLSAV